MGIGFAVAKRCADEGAKLIVVSRHEDDLRKAIEKLKNGSQEHRYYALDVSDEKMVEDMSVSVGKDLESVDGLVNCAGIYGPIGKTDEINPAEFVSTIKINLFGTFYMCHYFLPLLKKSPRGKIVNFAGGGAASPFPNYSAYSLSKISVVRLTENMALEFARANIDINAIAPGFVMTRLHQETIKAGEKAGGDFLKKTLSEMEKGGVPAEEAASLAAFLLSRESDGITGKFISAHWDSWTNEEFLDKLKTDKDFATIRRVDDIFFEKQNNQ